MNIKEFGWEGRRGRARSAKYLGGGLRIPTIESEWPGGSSEKTCENIGVSAQ